MSASRIAHALKLPRAIVVRRLQEMVNLSPRGIRTHLQLNRAIYLPTASYGHFGREPEANGAFSWEKTDLVAELKREFGVSNAA